MIARFSWLGHWSGFGLLLVDNGALLTILDIDDCDDDDDKDAREDGDKEVANDNDEEDNIDGER